jgi:hypothetical protein
MPVSYRYPDAPEPRPALPVRPEAVLAAAVIKLAMFDATRRWTPPEHANSARAFLTDDDGGLTFWLTVAGFDEKTSTWVRAQARRAVSGAPAPRTGSSRLMAASGF